MKKNSFKVFAMEEKKVFTAHNLQDSEKFAAWLAQQISPPTIILLEGPLGSGKTTLAKALARTLGITTDVNSPTFNLHHKYTFSCGKQNYCLHHIDLYRIKTSEEATELFHFLNEEQNYILLVEWPSRLLLDFSLVSVPVISITLAVEGTTRFFYYQFL